MSELETLYFDISDWVKGKPGKSFLEIYNLLASGTVKKSQERIKELELQTHEIINKSNSTLNKGISGVNPDDIDETAKKLKYIYYEVRKLMAFDSELEKHYQMLFNCISINPVETISIDEINRVKSFFELDSSDTKCYESDRVKKIGTFPSKK